MKNAIASVMLFLAATGTAQADYYHQRQHGPHRGGPGYNWVAPLVIGGVVGYALTRPAAPPPPVVVAPPYNAPYGFHWETIVDAGCNCYRTVLVQNY
jgi:hypothetical protein